MRKVSILFLMLFCFFSENALGETLTPELYPQTSRYLCRTEPIEIHSGQNLNLLALTSTCPRAQKIFGPGPASPQGTGWITRFRPDLVEILPRGKTTTPRVDDLHLHHVVWLQNGSQPTFAAGEEKTFFSFPRGYGLQTTGDARWGINYMIHNLGPRGGRMVEIRWTIDWSPEFLRGLQVRWMDVAGDQLYPVFDAERKYDTDRDGRFVFPDDAWEPLHPERDKISRKQYWEITTPVTLVFAAGHLHPGGLWTDLRIRRGNQIRTLFRSRAKYWGPAGAASWDVSLEATRRDWRVRLLPGDVLSLHAGYDVSRASWYEAMGIMPLLWSQGHWPEALDPFDPRLRTDGILTHKRLPENIDDRANKNIKLTDPRRLPARKRPVSVVSTKNYLFSPGGFSAVRGFPRSLQRPASVMSGKNILFVNNDAPLGAAQEDQIWHTITSCKAPCNRSAGISYPLADGRFDSGQLGYGIDNIEGLLGGYGYWNASVTTGSNRWTLPARSRRGTYTFFCRIHPFMRGSFRVR